MDASFELRLATVDDVEAMRDVEVDASRRFRDFPVDMGLDEIADEDPPAADVLRAHIGNATAWVVVDVAAAQSGTTVDDARRVVGYALASMMDDDAHLDQVSVRESAGRRGIGTSLVHAACRWASAQAFASITLTAFRDVPFNGPYYARLGFVELPVDRFGPELRSLRELEDDIGLDAQPRVAMRRPLG